MHTTPVSLLQRLRAPSTTAWPEFVALYTPLLYSWARRLGLKADTAADLLQDVFVVLVEKLPLFEYDPNLRFRGWLWIVCKNKWLAHKRRVRLVEQPLGLEHLDDMDTDNNVQEWQEEEYREQITASALRILRSEFHTTTWQAFWAVVVEGQGAAEVAADLGLTVNAVHVAKSRVLKRLREKLEGMLD
jgi:RNA polymerase sigma-70 factor, ECF subfamily